MQTWTKTQMFSPRKIVKCIFTTGPKDTKQGFLFKFYFFTYDIKQMGFPQKKKNPHQVSRFILVPHLPPQKEGGAGGCRPAGNGGLARHCLPAGVVGGRVPG